ncbi:MAG: cobalt-precorrin 5A hydrolase [Clostridiales bacterium]|nr:cobalt-precorrin 5A hydrolase [Clostridiales bacterium]
MILRAIAFSERGELLGAKLGISVDRGIPVMRWASEAFAVSDALLFIGACGIAVRSIAPLVRDKTKDPAVIVMDEAGTFVIPILSGHIGGANALAKEIAEKIGGTAVITTATDVQGVPAIDTWAVANDCAIENPSAIKDISSAALASKPVGVMITERTLKPPFPVTLTLRPRTLTLGVGCKRGITSEHFEACVLAFLKDYGVSLLSVRALATIDLKAEEPALQTFCGRYHLPLRTYTADELSSVSGQFAHSDFVQKTVGVGCVCERAAVLASRGILLMGKTAMDGVTLALAGEDSI